MKTVYKFLSYNSPLKNEFTIGVIPLLNFNLIMNLNSKFYKKNLFKKIGMFYLQIACTARLFFRKDQIYKIVRNVL
ncbi:hypothetical protein B1J93_15620 [Leptospira kirschneri serovar Pomona]|uniref:Uncharacterized protein n=2 Tax=Leptospira kirschneri TaxID=29507 RepID=A0A1T1DIZ6_9LEPT|nr:hypothetical protein B1J93_15620 [Leptospira kirschneri serovar Pomona]